MRVSYVWYDHECYIIKLNDTVVGTMFKTFDDYWTFKPFEVKDDELNSFLKASFPSAYYEKLIIAKREISKKTQGMVRIMQTIRFDICFLGYIVWYRNIVVGYVNKERKGWKVITINPLIKIFNPELSNQEFSSLNDAKRFIRIRINKFYCKFINFRKRINYVTSSVMAISEMLKST
ncbi:hypothetical protein [Parasutterella excrementihominis]|uniref:hypothetical protein n=1 Tax=Parasutterella excrementihominis TaxID=487175 RepID=UPI0012BC0A57|nr:hypothetical protein [Parasutterella excrementihominis]MTT64676.1 hypothetical protein [Parasutterella excrementihominis]MTT92997.1 hypothetical protein [Parasutterella excrementihominis]